MAPIRKVLFIGLLGVASYAAVAHEAPRIIVKFKDTHSALLTNQQSISKTLGQAVDMKPMANGAFVATIKPHQNLIQTKSLHSVLDMLNARDDVLYAVEDKKGYFKPEPKLDSVTSNLSRDLQWDEFTGPGGVVLETKANLEDGAWQYSHGESAVPTVVAVLDTGVVHNPRLKKSFFRTSDGKIFGWNFAGNNDNIDDETGSYHGEHVAGTIAAHGQDMKGMGPKLKILPIKIPDASGMFYESAVINGIHWALGHHVPGVPDNPYPAKVMSMSFGIDEAPGKEVDFCDAAVQDAVDTANREGAAIIVAAGNSNAEHDLGSPAGCKGTIRVASTGPLGLRSYFSNYGEGVTYAAPGGDKHYGAQGGILSTVKPGTGVNNSGLAYYQGTSMAAPHVSGLFGLVFAYGQNQNITLQKVKEIVYATTHGFGSSNKPDDSCVGQKSCGHGIIDALNALKAVDKNYQKIIVSPTLAYTDSGCERGYVRAVSTSLSTKEGEWKLIKNGCVIQNSLPELTASNATLTSNISGIQYQLHGDFSNCEKIGADGVGCF